MKIEELIVRWAAGEIPAKRELVDEYGCMCAQGQVLHYCGGWSKDRLAEVNQREADRAVAKLLGISITHAVLLRQVNDREGGKPAEALTAPEKILGSQAATLLAFWRHLDTLTPQQLQSVIPAWNFDAASAALAAAEAAAGTEAWNVARASVWTSDFFGISAITNATAEILGAEVLRQQGRKFHFLPLFGFESPEAVLAKP
jgi:hypothetical protein